MLWGLNSLLIVILGFMVRTWVNGIGKKLNCKQDKAVCNERYPDLKADVSTIFKHKHPLSSADRDMTGGVIIS